MELERRHGVEVDLSTPHRRHYRGHRFTQRYVTVSGEDMPRNVFIAYDFDIEGGLSDRLQWVKKNAGPEFNVSYPDAADGRSQGEIWRDIVQPRIREADSV